MGRFIDLTGQRFGRLTVIGRAPNCISKNGNPSTRWKCVCSCGTSVIVRRGDLLCGRTLSCGCFNREIIKVANKKRNTFRVDGDRVFVKLSNSDKEMTVDRDVWFGWAKEYCWTEDKRNGYAVTTKNGRTVMFHVFAFPDCPDGMVRDHINGNRLDNRKDNIRFVTARQNAQNHGKSTRNKSGCVGVTWDAERKKWLAQIQIYGKGVHLGRFSNIDDAIAAREAAEIKYFGEYRRNK